MQSFFFISPTSPQEVEDVIKSLNIKKATLASNIKVTFIKAANSVIALAISETFNLRVYNKSVISIAAKVAKVIPVFKQGNQTNYSNYRPISLLSSFSKIFFLLIDLQLSP